MGTNCSPLLADLFHHSYKADFIAILTWRKEHWLPRSFDLSFCYMDDILSLNNPSFWDFIHCIYTKELEIKDTTDTMSSPTLKDRRCRKTHYKHDDISFCQMATSLQHLEFSYHNSFIMPELVVTCCNMFRLFIIRLLEQGYIATSHQEHVDGYDVSICTIRTHLFTMS